MLQIAAQASTRFTLWYQALFGRPGGWLTLWLRKAKSSSLRIGEVVAFVRQPNGVKKPVCGEFGIVVGKLFPGDSVIVLVSGETIACHEFDLELI